MDRSIRTSLDIKLLMMLADLLKTNFCLNIFAGLCLPPDIVRLKWPKFYLAYMILTDLLSILNLITIGVNLLSPDVPLAKRCYSGFTALATAMSVAKLLACYMYKNRLRDHFELWDDLVEKNADDELKEALLKNQKQIEKLSIGLFVFMVSPMIPWGSLPLFIKIISFSIPTLEDSYYSFIAVPATFPFDPLKSPAFEFVTIFQGVAAVAVNAKLMAYDCLIYGLISSQIVQFKCLRKRFKNIVRLIPREQKDKENVLMKCNILWAEKKMLLDEWVQDHNNLVKICHSFNKIYSPVLFLQFFFSTLILCLNAFVVAAATITKFEIAFSIGYVLVTIIQLFVLCSLGEEITLQSKSLTQDGFWQEWYDYPTYICTSLMIIFERNKVPVKISAFGVIRLSIETFKSIAGTAYSYFMVLNQLRKKI